MLARATERRLRAGSGRPTLGDLMALYESNYIRLRRMLPLLEAMPERAVSEVPGALSLHFELQERTPYTTSFRLTYLFCDQEGTFAAPDLLVRMYHDARLAEVLRLGRWRSRREALYDLRTTRAGLEEKWRVNRFLQKWLGFCLRQGHRLAPPGRELASTLRWEDLIDRLQADPLPDAAG
ncbi:MAG: DUF1249 domain-containing protein [Gammaproteobacteria bacterium]|nr:MAG: DUF1249 domain-containing protein [Gammaproteobacteria bacterium]